MRLEFFNSAFPVILAPMAGVTDMPFRVLCKELGCDLTYTEMVSAKGLHYKNQKTRRLLQSAPEERPCGVQLFGREPGIMADMARYIQDMYPDEIGAIDINMGCPAPKITSNGEGSALMRDMPLAAKVIRAVSGAVSLPVTVKFRKGWDESHVNAVAFSRMAEENGAAAIALHGRTRAQGYSGKADWDIIGEAKAAVKIPLLGNGDVFSAADALRLRAYTGCDGVLVARGARGNPFIFREIQQALKGNFCAKPDIGERVDMAVRHARLQAAYKGAHGVIEMRKHIAWYTHGLPGAAQLRVKANSCGTLDEMEKLLLDYARGVAISAY